MDGWIVWGGSVIKAEDGKYILFYVGTTYEFELPTDSIPRRQMYEQAWNGKS